MGRVYRPKFSYTRADGTRVEKQTEAWYIEYADASGRWIRRKAGITKEQAQDALRKAEGEVLAERNGLPVQKLAQLKCRDLADAYLLARRPLVSRKQISVLTRRLDSILAQVKATFLTQLTPEKVEACLQSLADGGLSPRTQNCYLQAIKGVLNWAVRVRKIPYNPLDCVPKRPEHERRRVRRPLSEEEIMHLLNAAQQGPLRRKQHVYQNRPRKNGTYKVVPVPLPVQAKMAEEGRHMVLIYRILLETGLRRSEVRQLTWSDLDLENGTLTTRPEWVGNKNGKRETLPIPPGLVAALKVWRERRPATDYDTVVEVSDRLLRCFDDDLVAAGLARRVPVDEQGQPVPLGPDGKPVAEPARWKMDKRDAAGRVVDLHALRHTYGTRLVATGVDIKTVQTLMRHSSPELTLGIYVHADRNRLREAVRALPEIGAGSDAARPAVAEAAAG